MQISNFSTEQEGDLREALIFYFKDKLKLTQMAPSTPINMPLDVATTPNNTGNVQTLATEMQECVQSSAMLMSMD